MKFVAISDTHGRHRCLRLPKADVLLHAGDLTYKGEKSEVEDFLDWFGKQPHPYKLFIAGNHDFFFERTKPALIQSMLPPNVVYLKDEAFDINGLKIWGSPYTPWFYRWAFNKRRGYDLATHWAKMPTDVHLVMTHGPAYGILDMLANEQHAGDKELLQKLLEVKPMAHVCGHIHEAYGRTKRAGIQFYNACSLNERYETTNGPISFELKI